LLGTKGPSTLVKILLLGASGKIGWELQRSLALSGEVIAAGRSQVDFLDLDGLEVYVRSMAPDWIVNAAAYTAVDRAETEPTIVQKINADAVRVLAKIALESDAWLIHYSTDYVFDGEKDSPYVETDEPRPLSVYGKSKAAGERAIRLIDCKHFIFRTSWVSSVRGWNFPKAILKSAQERKSLQVVTDQIGAPTSAETIADVTAHCLRHVQRAGNDATKLAGMYHLASSGYTTWFDYAKLLLKEGRKRGMNFQVTADLLQPISSGQFPSIATRPKNSCLDTTKLTTAFDLTLPSWENSVKRILDELLYQVNFT
jgi:dTDP-4-dehydrorhamnose reductase